jgi:hypothetical protein
MLHGCPPGAMETLTSLGGIDNNGIFDDAKFNARIDDVEALAQQYAFNPSFINQVLTGTTEARMRMVAKDIPGAIHALNNALALINRARISEAVQPCRLWLFLAGLGWVIILYVVELAVRWWLPGMTALTHILPNSFNYLWMGLLGALTVSWWGIVRHSSALTTDPTYNAWYLLKPPLGAVMGVIAVLVIQTGFLAMGERPVQNPNYLYLIVAFLAGFSERFSILMIDKVMTALLSGSPTPTPAESSAGAATTGSVVLIPTDALRGPKKSDPSNPDSNPND